MDAISFVLGVRSQHLRASQLKHLVHAAGYVLSCVSFVVAHHQTLILLAPRWQYYTCGQEGVCASRVQGGRWRGDSLLSKVSMYHWLGLILLSLTLRFRCSVNAGGACDYKVNDKAVTQEAYIKKLESLNILSKARNFLVFQVCKSRSVCTCERFTEILAYLCREMSKASQACLPRISRPSSKRSAGKSFQRIFYPHIRCSCALVAVPEPSNASMKKHLLRRRRPRRRLRTSISAAKVRPALSKRHSDIDLPKTLGDRNQLREETVQGAEGRGRAVRYAAETEGVSPSVPPFFAFRELIRPTCPHSQAKLSRDWYLFQLYVIKVQMEQYEVRCVSSGRYSLDRDRTIREI